MKTIQSKLIVVLAIFFTLCVARVCISLYFLDKQKGDGVVINLSGKQRMLTQKMSKESLALSQGLGSKESLEKTMNMFDRTLKGLVSGDAELGIPATSNAGILGQINHVQGLWKKFNENLNTVIANSGETSEALSYIKSNNMQLLKEMNKAVVLLEKNEFDSKTINLAGKQRMLTQKMVKEILDLVQGGEADAVQNTSNLFDKTLKGLISGNSELGLSAMTDGAILAQLQNIQKLWDSFHVNVINVLELAPVTNNAIAYINGQNVELLKEMNKAVGMYEQQSAGKVAMLKWICIIIASITVITVILTWFIIVQPLIKVLKGIILNLSDGSHQMTSATEQISASSQSLAQGASEQASSLEQTSASMEEMASVTKQNASNADEAARLVDMCSSAAEKGNSAVGEMSKSMQEINTSNKKIAEFTKVIDGIAFQTNLLALNAAVEAARAGEHGKGFAVVAEEVRNLAQRSASAAKDTATLIDDCVNKADEGFRISGKCKESLEEIVKNVKKVTDLTKEIAGASAEQSEGVNQVSTAVQQMDQITQQNAATAEETASASEEMSAQAQSMNEQVGKLALQVGHAAERTSENGHEQPTRHARLLPGHRAGNQTAKLKGALGGTVNRAKGVANMTGNITHEAAQHNADAEAVIPMGENRVAEYDGNHKDF